MTNKVSLTFHTQKNGVKNATVTQLRTDTTLCPVRIWAEIIIRLDSYSGTTRDTPVNTVCVELQKTTVTSQTTTKSLRAGTLYFGKQILGSHTKRWAPTPFGQGSTNTQTHPSERGYTFLHKTLQTFPQQWDPPSGQ